MARWLLPAACWLLTNGKWEMGNAYLCVTHIQTYRESTNVERFLRHDARPGRARQGQRFLLCSVNSCCRDWEESFLSRRSPRSVPCGGVDPTAISLRSAYGWPVSSWKNISIYRRRTSGKGVQPQRLCAGIRSDLSHSVSVSENGQAPT